MTSIPTGIPAAGAYTTREHRAPTLWGRISWGPIMMGAVCAIGLQFIFTVLGIALGTSAGEVTAGADEGSARTVGVVAGLWWLITGTVALAVGGYVFGRLSGLPRSMPLKLEAATMWGVVAVFGFVVVWSGAGMLSDAVSPIAAMSASSVDRSTPRASEGATFRDSGGMSQISTATDTTTRAEAAAMADEARQATRTASWWAVIGLVLGLAATVGAAAAAVPAGGVRETEHPI
jgi:hypothetical protein